MAILSISWRHDIRYFCADEAFFSIDKTNSLRWHDGDIYLANEEIYAFLPRRHVCAMLWRQIAALTRQKRRVADLYAIVIG